MPDVRPSGRLRLRQADTQLPGDGRMAANGIEKGQLKQVSRQEALALKREAESYGMVNWMMNVASSKGQCSCSCCGCCCKALRAITTSTRRVCLPAALRAAARRGPVYRLWPVCEALPDGGHHRGCAGQELRLE